MSATSYHVFSLPPALLDTLTPRNVISPSQNPDPTGEQATASEAPSIAASKGPRSCNVCLGANFNSLEEQRSHFRSDWHRYNVKTRLNGGNPVAEGAFSQLIDALDESISGSESSSDDEPSDEDRVKDLLSRTKIQSRSPSPDETTRNQPQTPLTWFHSPPSTQIGVYRSLFTQPKDITSHLDELKEMQTPRSGGRTWAMFMVAGGHFAGAIVRVSPEEQEEEEEGTKKKKPKRPKPDTEVLRHKTFHRYTTRRKQGGSQSVNDNAKGPAKSAGALLRRYGEQALRDDIRNLLSEWAEDLDECERIWIRASVSNRRIFMDYDDAPISKGDERLRTFPFPTRRPTQSEIARCLLELTRVKISRYTEEELKAQDEAYLASLPKPKPKPVPSAAPEPAKPKAPKLTKEEEILRDKWSRLLEMVSRGRLDPLKAFWTKEESNMGGVDAQIPEWTGDRRSTLLQVASQTGHEEIVQWLLEDLHADPTIVVPNTRAGEPEEVEEPQSDASDSPVALPKGSRRTAYDLAKTKGVRDVFRRCAGAHPDWWDWLGAARVPSALSKDQEDERDEKKKVRRKGLKDRLKEREAKEKEKEKEQPKVVEEVKIPVVKSINPTTNKLGGASGSTDGVAGLTPEMRAKVERERRARAAEARLKTLGTR